MTEVPLSRVPPETLKIILLSSTMIFLPMCYWILRGNLWAYGLAGAVTLIWSVANAFLTFKMMNYRLALFSLAQMAFASLVFYQIWRELHRSYFDPGLNWYSSFPKFIPRFACQVKRGTDAIPCRANQFDRDGIFVFTTDGRPIPFDRHVELELFAGDTQIHVAARSMRLIRGGMGMGYKFEPKDLDQAKNVGDLVERLEGEGYVST